MRSRGLEKKIKGEKKVIGGQKRRGEGRIEVKKEKKRREQNKGDKKRREEKRREEKRRRINFFASQYFLFQFLSSLKLRKEIRNDELLNDRRNSIGTKDKEQAKYKGICTPQYPLFDIKIIDGTFLSPQATLMKLQRCRAQMKMYSEGTPHKDGKYW